ncbi:MAG: hypothetical protein IJM33_03310 [Bacteroidales bacterium]|nr:hypothetical protein [Bacteroidales bacterium]MBR3411991.1 hypothetical protein [Bacteroidales bacterium]
MKKVLFLSAIAALALCTSCNKEKNCRCTVVGTPIVRVVSINSGSCDNISHASYHDDLDTLHTEYILCTDYNFEADSLIQNH